MVLEVLHFTFYIQKSSAQMTFLIELSSSPLSPILVQNGLSFFQMQIFAEHFLP